MALTPLDIQQQRFATRFGGGLDKTEVDAFLQVVSSQVEAMTRENHEMREEARHLRRLLEDYRAREEGLKETMVTAQRVTDEMKKAAQKEADIIIGRAELEAERILETAQGRLSELLSDISEMKRQRAQFLMQVKGVVQMHQKLIDIAESEDIAPKLEENLAVMRKRPPTAMHAVADEADARAVGR